MNDRSRSPGAVAGIGAIALVLSALSLWAGPHAAGAARGEDSGSAGKTIKVIVYNVQFLPGLAGVLNERRDPEYRARTIGQKLADYDIVGLNEVFDGRCRELLLDQLRKAWGKDFNVIVSPKPADGRLIGGGAIASRLPFLQTNSTIYTAYSRPEKYGVFADGFAAKGVIHARIRCGQATSKADAIDVFVTHLDSKDDAARKIQYAELAEFVHKHSDPKQPTLIMGDMNTAGNVRHRQDAHSAYHTMMSIYGRARPGSKVVDVWPLLNAGEGGTKDQTSPSGGKRIDYVFLSNPLEGGPRLRPISARVRPFLDPRVVALSDHSAVEAVFRWGPP